MIVPVVMRAGERKIKTYVMLDGGATKPIINEKAAERFKLKYEIKNANLNTVEGSTHGKKKFAKVTIESIDGETMVPLEAVVLNFLTTEDDEPPRNEEIKEYEYMEGVKFDELENEGVSMLLSSEYAWTWLGGELRRSTTDKPMAIKTKFGWSLIGGSGKNAFESSCFRTAVQTDNDELHELCERLFRYEFPNILTQHE